MNENSDLFKIYSKYSYIELQKLFKKTDNAEEQEFYMTLANLILKTEQKKALKENRI